MATNGDVTRMAQGFSAAVARFPQAGFTIRRLMRTRDEFLDLCADLADAERAFADAEKMPPPLREDRQREWQELIDRLIAEIDAVLKQCERNGPTP